MLLKASSQGNVYPITLPHHPRSPVALLFLSASGPTWHRRLGHCGDQVLGALKQNNVIVCASSPVFDCVSCCLGKSHRLPLKDVLHSFDEPLALVHSDLW